MKRILLYGAVGGVLLAALRYLEYEHFVREYPGEVYGGFIALIFTAGGIYFGLRWTKPKEIVREVPVRVGGPFVLNSAKLAEQEP